MFKTLKKNLKKKKEKKNKNKKNAIKKQTFFTRWYGINREEKNRRKNFFQKRHVFQCFFYPPIIIILFVAFNEFCLKTKAEHQKVQHLNEQRNKELKWFFRSINAFQISFVLLRKWKQGAIVFNVIKNKQKLYYNTYIELVISKSTTTSVWVWKRWITKTHHKRMQQEAMCTQYTNKNEVELEFSRKRELKRST